MLQETCEKNKERLFFVRENLTYADLLRLVKLRAVTLSKKLGIKKGDTVALLCSNSPQFLVSYFAVVSQGARVLMLDTSLAKTEHLNMMARTNCSIALAEKNLFVEGGPEMYDINSKDTGDEKDFVAADVELDDLASLSFTSGSTGNPKIVGLTHDNILGIYDGAQYYRSVIKTGFIFYGFLPLYHIYGFVINIIAPIALDGSLLLQPGMNPKEFLADFKKYRPQVIPAVPRMWEVFYKKIIDGYREKRVYWLFKTVMAMRGFLRAIGLGFIVKGITKPVHEMFGGRVSVLISAGATLKPTIRKFYEALGMTVGDCYGLTETTGPSNFNLEFVNADGKRVYAGPLIGNEVKINEPNKQGIGEIYVRGRVVMPGYINNPEANADSFTEDGWYKTGDLGMFDKKGRLVVKGRKKQVIVLDSGKNVYPDELEDLYLQNPDILSAAVLERVIRGKMVAYGVFQVKPEVTMQKLAIDIASSNVKIAPYKWVTHYAMTTDELPQTSTKKVKHHEIREKLDRGEYPDRKE